MLRDGALDDTLVKIDDVDETATVLFNQVGWTYLALRVGQRWTQERAQVAVVTLLWQPDRITSGQACPVICRVMRSVPAPVLRVKKASEGPVLSFVEYHCLQP